MTKGRILSVKRFEIHDGDGVRSTLFLKGCPLSCLWCHNPESQGFSGEIAYYPHKCVGCGECASVCPTGAHRMDGAAHIFDREKCTGCGKCEGVCLGEAIVFYGREVTPDEICSELLKDKDYFTASGGGVTVSGGEPLCRVDFLTELLSKLRENGVNTAVDTCLCVSREALARTVPYTDTYLVDIKAIDPSLHKRLTGQDNALILDNLRYLDGLGCKMYIRVPYVPGQNDGEMEKIADLVASLRTRPKVKLLAYHDFAKSKYEALGLDYPMGDTRRPDKASLDAAREHFTRRGIAQEE